MSFPHFRPNGDLVFKTLQNGLRLRRQPDQGEKHFLEIKLGRIDFGMIAEDITVFFQCTDAPEARGGGDPGIFSQFDVGNATIFLQIVQDNMINLVQFDLF